jgi:Fe-S oxidoreductase
MRSPTPSPNWRRACYSCAWTCSPMSSWPRGVLVPIGTTCCGTAGDRSLLHPELVVSATRDERAALDEQPADRYVSANRTCEMGMRQATGKPYESFVFLAEELTRPANHLQSAGRRG